MRQAEPLAPDMTLNCHCNQMMRHLAVRLQPHPFDVEARHGAQQLPLRPKLVAASSLCGVVQPPEPSDQPKLLQSKPAFQHNRSGKATSLLDYFHVKLTKQPDHQLE